MHIVKVSFLTFIFLFLLVLPARSQINEGGTPPSFGIYSLSKEINTVMLPGPDLKKEVNSTGDKGISPPEVGPVIPVDISLEEEGTWTSIPGGGRLCRLRIKAGGALALALYYDRFQIIPNGRLFIYNATGTFIIGAYTSENSDETFATELVPGEEIIIEYHDPGNQALPEISISGVLYAHQNVSFLDPTQRDFGQSGFCEVNVNCLEGIDWQREKRGVARILLKVNSTAFWCTGSLINNVRQDSTPYFLTAAHCGQNATANDYKQWIFYFNYEAPTCDDPIENPTPQSLVGAALVAQAPDATSTGSDFKLLLLENNLPVNYNPYFNGWNRLNETSPTGVSIHHPKGDIKKISTYKENLKSTAYSSSEEDPEEKYWRVLWAPTQTNHGVTEGGSSGSPIFDDDNKIIGTLSGGFSSCQNQDLPDYYGKFSYSWESNSNSSSQQLKPWLDPDGMGVLELEGFGYGNLLSASFYADTTFITVGDYIELFDNSSGEPSNWSWTFQGGSPGQAEGKDPGKITYDSYGVYDVKLIVYREGITDTLLRRNYIHVGANIYPVPVMDELTLNFGHTEVNNLEIELYDTMGRLVKDIKMNSGPTSLFKWNISDIPAGLYVMKYKVNGMENPVLKIIIG
jgi:hypothetical protein